MLISPRTGKALITKQDIHAVERFREFVQALRTNCTDKIGQEADDVYDRLGSLTVAMHEDIDSRKPKKQPA